MNNPNTLHYANTPRKQLVTDQYTSHKQFFWFYWLKNNWFYMTISTIGIIITTFFATWPRILIGKAIDALREHGVGSLFYQYSLLIIVSALVAWLTYFVSAYLWTIVAFRFERDARQDFFEVITEHSMAFHDVNDSGLLLSMGMNEVGQMRMAYSPAIRQLFSAFLSLGLSTYFLYQINQVIGVTLLVSIIFYLFLAWRYARVIGPVRKKLAEDLGEVTSSTQEIFRGIDVVKSFTNEDLEREKFDVQNKNYAEMVKKEGYLSSFYWPALILILVTTFAFGYGLFLVRAKELTTGDLINILALLLALNVYNFFIPRFLLLLQAGLVNAERLWDVMTFKDPLVDHDVDSAPSINWDQEIVFDHVTFQYPGTTKTVLDDVSFRIPPKSKVVIVGGPGSGKSTILKLLLRFYDPTQGKIRIGNHALKDLPTKKIREGITLVEQDIFLFSDTIKANIAFANPHATMDEIKEAARKAQALNFIEALPEKFNTVIGERGVTLSGGQRQRLAIARAMLSNPRILLLDDFASAVDVKTEALLRIAIDELLEGRTSIIVTHRLSTLAKADMILFMKKGKLLDIGTHEELLARNKDYQFMCKFIPQISKEKLRKIRLHVHPQAQAQAQGHARGRGQVFPGQHEKSTAMKPNAGHAPAQNKEDA